MPNPLCRIWLYYPSSLHQFSTRNDRSMTLYCENCIHQEIEVGESMFLFDKPNTDPRLLSPQSTYICIKSTTVYVTSSELGLSQPLDRQRVYPSPQNRRGGGHTRLRVGVWGSPIPTTALKRALTSCVTKSQCAPAR